MEVNEKYLLSLIESISKGSDIKLSDIPDIELYMDQVTTFIDSKLGHLKRDSDDKLLTKTMINNYTKSKILLPSNNKKYDKQHMIFLILIYYLKQVLSISDIHDLFAPVFKSFCSGKSSDIHIADIYSIFLDIKENEFNSIDSFLTEKYSIIKEKTDPLTPENKELVEMFLIVLMLVTQANIQKRLAEKIIDEYFKPKDIAKPKDSSKSKDINKSK